MAFLLSKVNIGNITEKGTHLDSMLRSAISMLEHADTKNLLLFTDGGLMHSTVSKHLKAIP